MANVIKIPALCKKISRCRASVYAALNPNSPYYDPTMPRPIKLSERSIGFIEAEVDQWIESRIKATRKLECRQEAA